ncbi:MAG: response regulator transcription factor [Elusimicrobia bacterium]|nr:response regulator transcription factor [Elusimicrobiota bacterium]MDE2237650.1 response regulator transcription factor [Elusimicrobiota bacterium]MDE2426216.1 response regulator transcription factor [Elusimicrobiota bacterium]
MRVNVIYASREPNRAGVILEALGGGGMSVTVAQRAKEVMGLLANKGCDLLLVGQRLVDEEGLALVKNLRAKGPCRQIPIVALVEHGDAPAFPDKPRSAYALFGQRTADTMKRFESNGGRHQAEPAAPSGAFASDKVSMRLAFFQAGADECLSLNWDVAECVARIKAVLRRTQSSVGEEILKLGEIELNLTSYTLHVAGKKVPLTSKELDLLYVFLSSSNRVLSRPYLIERVWGYNYFGSPRTVDVHVRRLREKLGPAARFITTIPCVGYKLVPPGAGLRR